MAKIDPLDYAEDERMAPSPPATYGEGLGRKFFRPRMAHVFLVIIVFLGSSAFYFYRQLSVVESNPQIQAQNAQIQAQNEVKNLVATVSRLMVLPTGETPTVATVLDPSALKDQAFFANSEKGDKVLIYMAKRQAILYSPSLGKIVNVAPISLQNQSAADAASATAPTNTSSNPAKK